MLEKSLSTLKRIRENVVPDTLDNIASQNAPPSFERAYEEPEDAAPVLDRLFPKDSRAALRSLTKEMVPGVTYRSRVLAGKNRETKHPHDFVIEKSDSATSFYFVDPEHYVGERQVRRPSIGNLVAMKLHDAPTSLPEVAILRFRTHSLVEDDRKELKMTRQLEHARELLPRNGVPSFLDNTREEITFRTVVNAERGVVQSRYVGDTWGLELFLEGASSASVLEGKVASQQAIVQSFVSQLEKNAFQPVEDKRVYHDAPRDAA